MRHNFNFHFLFGLEVYMKKMILNINGADKLVTIDPEETLANTLRAMGLTGTKVGCGTGQCGLCSHSARR